MKRYPSIGTVIDFTSDVYVFDKLDGSNIRAEWSRKRNEFYKFGSRGQLLDHKDPVLGDAITLIRTNYERDLANAFSSQKWERAIAFFEFMGPSSFAGRHVMEEEKTVTLIDVAAYKHGLLDPKTYIELFGNVQIAKLLHVGKLDDAFVESVKLGTLEGMTFEGVVCKVNDQNASKMFKIKNRAWLKRLKEYCGTDEKLFESLA